MTDDSQSLTPTQKRNARKRRAKKRRKASMPNHLVYRGTDNGLCRIYYRRNKALICFQLQSPGRFQRLLCTRDGEPCHVTDIGEGLPLDRIPPPDCDIAREFITWAMNNNLSLLRPSLTSAAPNTVLPDSMAGSLPTV